MLQMALNQLGILVSELRGPKEGLPHLLRAESIHAGALKILKGTSPWTPDDLFSSGSYDNDAAGQGNKREGAVEERNEGTIVVAEEGIRNRTEEGVEDGTVKGTQEKVEGRENGEMQNEKERQRKETFEDVHTHTLYFLAQVSGESILKYKCYELLYKKFSIHK